MLGLYSIVLLHNLYFFIWSTLAIHKQEHFCKVIIPQGENESYRLCFCMSAFVHAHKSLTVLKRVNLYNDGDNDDIIYGLGILCVNYCFKC